MIHSTAIVDPTASLGEGVQVGPYSIIGPDVVIGDHCEIGPHVTLSGPTTIGRGNRIFQFASVGADPQDKKYAGEVTRLVIGDNNTIREFVTIHRGTAQDNGITRIGNDNWIMAYVHIAHDSLIGDRTVFANGASLAGHVSVDDDVILGGFTLVHQFCRIGCHSFTSMGSCIKQDVPPYVTVAGNPAEPHGINAEGLRRRGFGAETLRTLRNAYKTIYKQGLRLDQAIEQLEPASRQEAALTPLVDFLRQDGRGIVR
ncbi:UDP-N-acetylglucosamine acyltransferase [Natronocella acetinitrilica]|uniref:Acyl-[acyl-carrier-protein]--UDP-N-acetylglucosamine O-acyltransferase n=1 Tax=Natronocella acetinitrilica TaxID=414046 RepID=A0AAE3KDD8_9GAMM|nr:acyl-ACP--UDP-N-acetylglucosamine O-acyltransferase [Natronocella acetinitrilica]MCP1676158.1 UDP-N-acetylglucosamine acyltransferase [Natronocella acetinitrilica]